MSGRLRNSSLDKYTGIKNDTPEVSKMIPQMTPQEVAVELFGKNGATRWGKAIALASVDPALQDKAHRLLALLAIKSAGQTRLVEFGREGIMLAFGCSRMTAVRLIRNIEETKYAKVHRRHNKTIIFELCVELFATKDEEIDESEPVKPGSLRQCILCNGWTMPKKITEHGWCFPCQTKRADLRQMNDAFKEYGPDIPYELASLHIDANKKRGRKRAYLTLKDRYAKLEPK
jgi:hypothetical protein